MRDAAYIASLSSLSYPMMLYAAGSRPVNSGYTYL